MHYKLIRSRRRSLGLEVTAEGLVLVRAPMDLPLQQIEAFVRSRQHWLNKSLLTVERRRAAHPEPDINEAQRLQLLAAQELPLLVAHYGAQMGLAPAGITITGARKRFGSCSSKNRLCFSWRLMQWPREAIEYVVVHELAHIREKNHGPAFYAQVARILPDYQERVRLLKQ